MQMPIAEVLDRLSILRLKMTYIGERHLLDEYMACCDMVDTEIRLGKVSAFVALNGALRLYEVNRQIWNLEAALKSGKEKGVPLAEIGKRAIKIRDWNRARVTIKSEIVELTKQGYKDVKQNHLSARDK